MGGGGWDPLPRKFEICKLMCNRLRTFRIGRYAPGSSAVCTSVLLRNRFPVVLYGTGHTLYPLVYTHVDLH